MKRRWVIFTVANYLQLLLPLAWLVLTVFFFYNGSGQLRLPFAGSGSFIAGYLVVLFNCITNITSIRGLHRLRAAYRDNNVFAWIMFSLFLCLTCLLAAGIYTSYKNLKEPILALIPGLEKFLITTFIIQLLMVLNGFFILFHQVVLRTLISMIRDAGNETSPADDVQ